MCCFWNFFLMKEIWSFLCPLWAEAISWTMRLRDSSWGLKKKAGQILPGTQVIMELPYKPWINYIKTFKWQIPNLFKPSLFGGFTISLYITYFYIYIYIIYIYVYIYHVPGGSVVKNPPANARDTGDADSISRLGRSPGIGNGNLFQYPCLENPRQWTEEPGG